MTASKFSEIMKEANTLAGKTKEKPHVVSTKDQETKHLADRIERKN